MLEIMNYVVITIILIIVICGLIALIRTFMMKHYGILREKNKISQLEYVNYIDRNDSIMNNILNIVFILFVLLMICVLIHNHFAMKSVEEMIAEILHT